MPFWDISLHHFNPRPPCGERLDKMQFLKFDEAGISIHAPRAGSDSDSAAAEKAAAEFQSTPPVRGATFKLLLSVRGS